MALFEVLSKLNKFICLTEVQWLHIENKHPEMTRQLDKIIDTIKEPDFIFYCLEDDIFQYYRYFSKTPVTEKYLLSVVKHTNGDGFVITSFFIRKINKNQKEVIYGEENLNKL